MKKVTKRTKLLEQLNIETLRHLSGAELAIAVGGNNTYGSCYPTLARCTSTE